MLTTLAIAAGVLLVLWFVLWVAGRIARRRIKKTLDERGIEIPYPHLSVYLGEASKLLAVQVSDLPPPAAPSHGVPE